MSLQKLLNEVKKSTDSLIESTINQTRLQLIGKPKELAEFDKLIVEMKKDTSKEGVEKFINKMPEMMKKIEDNLTSKSK